MNKQTRKQTRTFKISYVFLSIISFNLYSKEKGSGRPRIKNTQQALVVGRQRSESFIVADTLWRTQMFPCLPPRARFVADTKFVSEAQKMFLISFRNILCPQQMFPRLLAQENIMSKKCVLVCHGDPCLIDSALHWKDM